MKKFNEELEIMKRELMEKHRKEIEKEKELLRETYVLKEKELRKEILIREKTIKEKTIIYEKNQKTSDQNLSYSKLILEIKNYKKTIKKMERDLSYKDEEYLTLQNKHKLLNKKITLLQKNNKNSTQILKSHIIFFNIDNRSEFKYFRKLNDNYEKDFLEQSPNDLIEIGKQWEFL
jgi:hypothetical protein